VPREQVLIEADGEQTLSTQFLEECNLFFMGWL
jgi:hypothetical protein